MIKGLLSIITVSTLVSHTLGVDSGPPATGYRSINGSGNNPYNTGWGQSGVSTYAFITTKTNSFADNVRAVPVNRPPPKLISTAIFGAETSISQSEISDLAIGFGQLLTHDIALTSNHPTEVIPIQVMDCDLTQSFSTCSAQVNYNLARKTYSEATGVREILNQGTPYVDLSQIYGNTNAKAALLRLGTGGLLKEYRDPRTNFNTMPLTDPSTNGLMSSFPYINITKQFFAGDPRTNMHPLVTTCHVLFFREHNRRARQLAQANPTWDDETIYQRARAWNIALMQKITYEQYIPAVLGQLLPNYQGYDPTVRPDLDVFFAGASFRYAHSGISPIVFRLDSAGKEHVNGHLLLRDSFFNVSYILDTGCDIDPVLRGLVMNGDQVIDSIMIPDMRKYVFLKPFDLATIDVARGYDYGLPDYNSVRIAFNLTPAVSFSDITKDQKVAARLAQVYNNNISNVDAWVGGLAEPPAYPSHMGELFTASLLNQFQRIRDGDRFWYERDGVLTPSELAEIKSWNFGRLVETNTNITNFPVNPFLAYSIDFTSPAKSTGNSSSNVAAGNLQVTSTYRIEWKLISSSNQASTGNYDMVEFNLCGNFTGWMGIGFSAVSSQQTIMFGSNLVAASKTSPSAPWTVRAFNAVDQSIGRPYFDVNSAGIAGGIVAFQDSDSDASAICYSTQGVRFRRYLKTGISGLVDLSASGQFNLLYAYSTVGSLGPLAYHGPGTRGSVDGYSFVSSAYFNSLSSGLVGGSVDQTNIYVREYHGSLMFASVGVTMPMGMFCIRYLVTYTPLAIPLHKFIMIASTISNLWMIGMMFASQIDTKFAFVHSIIGLSLISSMILNVSLGLLSLQKWRIVSRFQRYIRFIHRNNGRAIVLLSWINAYLGLNDLLALTSPTANYKQNLLILYLSYISFVILVMFLLGESGFLERHLKRIGVQEMVRASSTDSVNFGDQANKGILTFTWEEFNTRVYGASGHNYSKWIVISGNIYDVSTFIDFHPGGPSLLWGAIGTNATRAFYGTISKAIDFSGTQDDEGVSAPDVLLQGRRKSTGKGKASNEKQAKKKNGVMIQLKSVSSIIQSSPQGSQIYMGSGGNNSLSYPGQTNTSMTSINTAAGNMRTDEKMESKGVAGRSSKLLGTTLLRRPTNLHSRVAMQHLSTFFVGIIRDYHNQGDEDDEDDLYPNPRGAIMSRPLSSQSRLSTRSFTEFQMMELNHLAFRTKVIQQMFKWPYKRLGIKTNYFMNVRLVSKRSVLTSPGKPRRQVYRMKFAFDRMHHSLVILPGECVEICAWRPEMKESKLQTGWVTQKYTPISVYNRGFFEVDIKIYDKGALTPILDSIPFGGSVRVRGPVFHDNLMNKATATGCYRQVLMIAGGTGISPMMLMMDYYIRMRQWCEREGVKLNDPQVPAEMTLIQCYHSDSEIIDTEATGKLLQRSNGLIWAYTLVSEVHRLDYSGRVGRLSSAALKEWISFYDEATSPTASSPKATKNAANLDFQVECNFHIFVCGPKTFNNEINFLLNGMGFHEKDITLI